MMPNKNCVLLIQVSTQLHQLGVRTLVTNRAEAHRSFKQIRARQLSNASRRDNGHQQKSLNWLIRPHREKNEPTSTIPIGQEATAQNSTSSAAQATAQAQPEAEKPSPAHQGTFYRERIILGYSPEQMCDLVGNVPRYKEFLPFCINSEIIQDESKPKPLNRINLTLLKNSNAPSKFGDEQKPMKPQPKLVTERESLVLPPSFKARLEIGYPPIREAYTSHVSIIRPNLVKSISRDTRLFEFLINEWKFSPMKVEQEPTRSNDDQSVNAKSCIVEFYVSFKFRSPIYSRFSGLFMDQIFCKMVNAFTNRALVLYGKPSMDPKELEHSNN